MDILYNGDYEIIDDENRLMDIEINDKEAETKIIVCENGECINFEYPIRKNNLKRFL